MLTDKTSKVPICPDHGVIKEDDGRCLACEEEKRYQDKMSFIIGVFIYFILFMIILFFFYI